jgi:hypothetical protein
VPSFDPDSYLKKQKEFNPDAYLQKQQLPIGKDIEPESAPRIRFGPDVPVLEALAKSYGQGVTLDNIEEILAGAKSTFGEKSYEDYLAEEQRRMQEIEQERPLTSFVGRTGGYLTTGGLARGLVKPATRLGTAAMEAGLGAIQGFGSAESDEDKLSSMGEGAVLGGVGSTVFDTLGKAIRTGAGKASDLFSDVILNTPKPVSQALRKDPKYFDDLAELDEIAENVAGKLGSLQASVRNLNEQAIGTLANRPLQNKAQVVRDLEELPGRMSLTGVEDYPENQAILNEIERARNVIMNAESERELKNLLTTLGRKADFGTPGSSAINSVRKQIRGIVNRSLKEQNPEYAAAMLPLAKQTRALDAGIKESRVGLEDGMFVPSNRTVSRLETLMNSLDKSKNQIARSDLERVYPGLEEALRKQKLFRQSQGGVTSGSRNVNLGFGIGSGAGAIGEVVNAATGMNVPPSVFLTTGAIGGAVIDKYGRSLGSAIAKAGGRAGKFLDKYGDMFKTSANKEATHQFLLETDPEYRDAYLELERGFNDPASLANLVGSAVLGSDLTRGVASVGAGIGGAMEGRPFAEGMEERYRELEQNPSQLEGVLSMAGAMLPTGRAGSLPSKIIRGVQGLDELLSDTGKQKNAPNLMNIKMPDGTEFGSKIGDSKKAKELLDGLKLKNKNKIEITSTSDNNISGYINHPDYPKHTKFSFDKDSEGLWVLNSNYRSDRLADIPQLKGSSTDMRRAFAEALGGVGSDRFGRNSKVGQISYLRDEQAMPTSPDVTSNFRGNRMNNQSRFFTPGDEQQKEDFIKAFQESYKIKPEDVDRKGLIDELALGLPYQYQGAEQARKAEARLLNLRDDARKYYKKYSTDPAYRNERLEAKHDFDERLNEIKTKLRNGDVLDNSTIERLIVQIPTDKRTSVENAILSDKNQLFDIIERDRRNLDYASPEIIEMFKLNQRNAIAKANQVLKDPGVPEERQIQRYLNDPESLKRLDAYFDHTKQTIQDLEREIRGAMQTSAEAPDPWIISELRAAKNRLSTLEEVKRRAEKQNQVTPQDLDLLRELGKK